MQLVRTRRSGLESLAVLWTTSMATSTLMRSLKVMER